MSSKTFTPPKSWKNIGLAAANVLSVGGVNALASGGGGLGLSIKEKKRDATEAATTEKDNATAREAQLAQEASDRAKAKKRAEQSGSRAGASSRGLFSAFGYGSGNRTPDSVRGNLFGN